MSRNVGFYLSHGTTTALKSPNLMKTLRFYYKYGKLLWMPLHNDNVTKY